jgi:hypothetical protein
MLHLAGRAKVATAKKLQESVEAIRSAACGQLHKYFAAVIEPEKIHTHSKRVRDYPLDQVFWLMLEQLFSGGSLRDAVRVKLANEQAAKGKSAQELSSSSSAFCQARQRMPMKVLEETLARTSGKLNGSVPVVGNRNVYVVDGTGITLADTPANQAQYPQPSGQKPGCGFPLMQVVGLLNLGTRALEKVSYSPMNTDEGGMFDVDLLKHLKAGDILMSDRGFFSYVRLAMLANGGVDVVMRLNSAACWPKEISGDEGWVQRRKPSLAQTPMHWTDAEWEALPPTTAIRYVRVRVQRKGFRPQTLYLATTIADISAAELANLYFERWAVELCFDDLKTTLGMDFVPVKSPQMAEKLVLMLAIVHNLIRWVMNQSSRRFSVPAAALSFKGALDGIARFARECTRMGQRQSTRLFDTLLAVIASDRLPLRPGRIEPRVRKRRPKNFDLMTRARSQYRAEIAASWEAQNTPINALS